MEQRGDLGLSPSNRRQRRLIRSRRQTGEVIIPSQSSSGIGGSTSTSPYNVSGLSTSLLRSQSQPPFSASDVSPNCGRRFGDLLLGSNTACAAHTESTAHVALGGDRSSPQRLRRYEGLLSPRSGSSNSLVQDRQSRYFGGSTAISYNRHRPSSGLQIASATSDSHLSHLSMVPRLPESATSHRGVIREADDEATLSASSSDAPVGLLRRSEAFQGEPSLASLARGEANLAERGLEAASREVSPLDIGATITTSATATSLRTSSSPIYLRFRHEGSGGNVTADDTSDARTAASNAANQEPESDHDFFQQTDSTRPLFRSIDQTQRAFASLNDMRKRGLLCDVILKACDIEVPAHKNVLAASSPYFHAMFTGDMTEKNATCVNIGHIDGAALAQLIDFIYTAEVLVTEETVQTLLPAANLLQLSSVREACCEFLQCQLHPSNCLGIQRFADMHDCSELLLYSRRFTEQHFGEVLEQGDEFLNLTKDQLVQLISSDHIRVSEEVVFEAVLRWIWFRSNIRQPDAAEICSHVRFALLPRDYLVRLSQSDSFLYENPWCKDYLLEAMGYHLLPWEHKRRVTSERMKPRTPSGLASTLVVIGGQAPKAIRSVECYDFRTDTWTMATYGSPSTLSTNAASGCRQAGFPASPLSRCQNNINGSLLQLGQQTPVVSADLPSRRCRCGVAVVGGLIYVVGGFNGALRVRSVDIYDPVRKLWRAGPNMEHRRSTLGVAVLDGVIYAVGGFDGTKGFSSVECFDPWVGTWKLVASMVVSRSSVGVGVLGNRLYAVGGYDGATRRCLSSVECYDPATNKWVLVSDMNHRRSGPAVTELEGRLYAVGGHDGLLVHNSVECYDHESGVWCNIADMHICRRNAGLVAHNGMLYVVGGDDGSSNLRSVETYDPQINVWSLLQSQMHTGRCYAAVAIIDWNVV